MADQKNPVTTTATPAATKPAAKTKAESKRERFVRLAEQRVTAILKRIINVGNLSGASYEFTESDVKKIFGIIREQVDLAEGRFLAKGSVKKSGFTL